MKSLFFLIFLSIFSQASSLFYYDSGIKIDVNKIDSYNLSSDSNIEYYENTNSQKLGVNNTLIIKLIKDTEINQLIEQYNLELIKNLGNNSYLLSINNNDNVFYISALLYENSNIEFSQPNFIKNRRRR